MLVQLFSRFEIARILLGGNSLVTHHYQLSSSFIALIDPLHTAMDGPIGRRLVSRFVIAGRQSCGHSRTLKEALMTQCKDEFRNLSGCVTEILTASRINIIFF